jgi:starch phosphorylase
MVLGIGGVRVLRALGLSPTAWHINEGHAAFMVLERAREHVAEGHALSAALELVASGTVFTTHTPVAAGHDIFECKLVGSYLAPLAAALGVGMPGVSGDAYAYGPPMSARRANDPGVVPCACVEGLCAPCMGSA